MKRKKQSQPKISPTALAAELGCSRQLVSRLLRQGHSRDAIIQRVTARKAREAELAAGRAAAVPFVNGHAAAAGVPPYAVSQATKEFHLSRLREIEAGIKGRDLLRVEPLRRICFGALHYLTKHISYLPDEMSAEFGQACGRALRQRINYILAVGQQITAKACAAYGIALPPEEPPRPPSPELAYYQQYVPGSMAGEVEAVNKVHQIGTPEWTRLHPSIGFQESFQISRKKRQWDADMAALLARRSEWDLPPETPVEPPPGDDAA
jgi:hypothetical protein